MEDKNGSESSYLSTTVDMQLGQIMSFELAEDIDPSTPVGELFHRGDIQVVFGSIDAEQRAAKMVVMARNFKVVRHEMDR